MTYQKIIGEVTVFLGGRAAEELFLEDVSTGASNDIQQATRYVRAMVCEWGMTPELGLINYNMPHDEERYFVGGHEFSEATAEMIDRRVREIADDCYRNAKALLKEHEDDMRLIVDALMEFEVLGKEEFNLLLDHRSLEELRTYRRSHMPIIRGDTQKLEEAKETPPAP